MMYWFAAIVAAIVVVTGQETCEMKGPVDLGHWLTPQSFHAIGKPFVPGKLSVTNYKNTKERDNSFCTGEHVGTHLDAPFHFSDNGWSVDQIPADRLITNGVFLNMSAETAGDISFRLQASHIDDWIKRIGTFPENAFMLISYGWSQRYHDMNLYVGTTDTTKSMDFKYPGMTVEAANKLASIPQLVGIGVDTPSVDAPETKDAHVIFAAKSFYNMEMVNMDHTCLPEKGFKVISMPVAILGGTGAPARIIATPVLEKPSFRAHQTGSEKFSKRKLV